LSKRILYLTFYFEPDLCAGSFRNSQLAKDVALRLNEVGVIDIITTMPNRYNTYKVKAEYFESKNNYTIQRIKIPLHKSGIWDQINSFRVYFSGVLRLINKNEYDLVFASSSRFFTAFLGYYIASRRSIPLYLDIRDIFSENIKGAINNIFLRLPLVAFLKVVERRVFKYAKYINLISPGFTDYFSPYQSKCFYFTNGIDDDFISVNHRAVKNNSNSVPKIITYAGNIGEGQGLEKIIPLTAQKLQEKVHFIVIGDGGTKDKLSKSLNDLRLKNVELIEPVNRTRLIEYYLKSNYLLIHLNDMDAFKSVLPSKVFEYGAIGKPIIAGVSGYAKEFIEEQLPDSFIFRPCRWEELVEFLETDNPIKPQRDKFIERFKRSNVNRAMATSIVSTIE